MVFNLYKHDTYMILMKMRKENRKQREQVLYDLEIG